MNKTLSRIRPEVLWGLIAFSITILIIVSLYFDRFSGNITGFFRIGSVLPLSPFLDPKYTFFFKGELGYDGQQFLSIALDPFLTNDGTIAALDHPIYRYRRILYPLLGYIFGLGQPRLIPYALVAINAIAVGLIVGFITVYFRGHGVIGREKSLLALTIPGVWIVISLSTADLLGSLFLVGALLGEHKKQPFFMAAMVALAMLTRETLVILWLALLINNILLKRIKFVISLLIAAIPTLLWNSYVMSLHLSGASGMGNLTWPFAGIIHKIDALLTGSLSSKNLFEFYLFGLLILIFVFALWSSYYTSNYNRTTRWATYLYLGLFLVSSPLILNYFLDYTRVFIDVYFLGLLMIKDNKEFPLRMSLYGLSGIGSFAFLTLHS